MSIKYRSPLKGGIKLTNRFLPVLLLILSCSAVIVVGTLESSSPKAEGEIFYKETESVREQPYKFDDSVYTQCSETSDTVSEDTKNIVSDNGESSAEHPNVKPNTNSAKKVIKSPQDTRSVLSTTTQACEKVENNKKYTQSDVEMLARLLNAEAGSSWIGRDEKENVIWVVLNRVDDNRFPNTIRGVVTAPHQFSGYNNKNYWRDIPEELLGITKSVLDRWSNGEKKNNYLFFSGNGKSNTFR